MDVLLVYERKGFFCTLAFILGSFSLALSPCRSAHCVVSFLTVNLCRCKCDKWCGKLGEASITGPLPRWQERTGGEAASVRALFVGTVPSVPSQRYAVILHHACSDRCCCCVQTSLWHTARDLCVSRCHFRRQMEGQEASQCCVCGAGFSLLHAATMRGPVCTLRVLLESGLLCPGLCLGKAGREVAGASVAHRTVISAERNVILCVSDGAAPAMLPPSMHSLRPRSSGQHHLHAREPRPHVVVVAQSE